MKTINFYKLFTLLFLALTVVSCVKDDNFDVPNTEVVAPNINANDVITIGALNDLLAQEMNANGNAVLEFTDSGKYITGYVISNDEAGNFFKELIIQDNAEGPTAGVKVLVDVSPLFTTFEIGRKIYVKLDGLTVGLDSGVLTLGIRDGNGVANIAESRQFDYLIRDNVVSQIVPLPIKISEFTLAKTNLFVRLSDVQFLKSIVIGENRKTFAAEPDDQFDGERILESCEEGNTAVFSTSTFADFKAVLLPQGRGTLDGILTLNFFGEDFNIVVNEPSTINFDNETRCDPEVFTCDGTSGGGSAFFNVNFEQFDAIEDYVNAGWTNVNVTGGSLKWDINNFSNNNYAKITGFSTNQSDYDVYLITPSINMDNTTGEELSFDIEASFDNGTILTVLFSTDFTGDATTATWQELDAEIPVGPSGGFGGFSPVGPINISCIDGPINIAFRYKGSDPSATTRYHVDNVKVTGN